MIAQYANSYPNREVVWLKYHMDANTHAREAYYPLIRKLSEVLNVYVLRPVVGEMRGMIYIVGRKRLAETFRSSLDALLQEIEITAGSEYDWQKVQNTVYNAKKKNPRKVLMETRLKGVNEATSSIQTILELKRDFYLDKYARMRKVRENEVNDQNFFLEYIRENHLTHLKRFKWR